jgi:hypothetical protein
MSSRKRKLRVVGLALSVLLILAASASIILRPMFGYPAPINAVRWLAWSRAYKAKVLTQPHSSNGDLQHIEWDGWGWAGQDTVVYLVFDPTNSLSQAAISHQPGKYAGIPCEVPTVRQLESNWYTVRFYTNDEWHNC